MEAKYKPLKDDPCYDSCIINEEKVCFFNETEALIILLQAGKCFFGSMWHPDKNIREKGAYLGIGVFVNCNDVFHWASADSEDLAMSEVEDLYRHHVVDNKWGDVIWLCLRRKLQPQTPIKEDMIKDGAWTDELKALPVSSGEEKKEKP